MKHTMHVPGTRCRFSLVADRMDLRVEQVTKELAKVGKVRRGGRKTAEKRVFPKLGEFTDTARYVAAYWSANFKGAGPYDHLNLFEPLSPNRQEWPSEPVYEALDAEEWVDSPEPQKASVEPLVPVVPVVPEVPEVPDQLASVEYVFKDGALPDWLTRGVPPDWLGPRE